MFLTTTRSFTIDLNTVPENLISVNETHYQIRITDFALTDMKNLVFISYPDLTDFIEEFKGDRNYCKKQYRRNDDGCDDPLTYSDFRVQLSDKGFFAPKSEIKVDNSGNDGGRPCGFCDYLFYGLESDFSIFDFSTEYSISRNELENRDLTRSSWVQDNCELKRVLRKLDRFCI